MMQIGVNSEVSAVNDKDITDEGNAKISNDICEPRLQFESGFFSKQRKEATKEFPPN